MKLKQDSRVLKRKALASVTNAVEAFNSSHDVGRPTKVLLHLQHAFEMLLKSALVQTGTKVFDRQTGRSIGFERCLGPRLRQHHDQTQFRRRRHPAGD